MGKKKISVQPNLDHLPSIYSTPDQFMFYGSGNPDSGFTLVTAETRSVAIKAKYRQGDDIEGEFNGKDTVNYDVPDGFQVIDPDHGVPSANPNRWAFSFDYAFADTAGPLKLDKLELKIDTDPTGKTQWLKLKGADVDNDGLIEWVDKKGNVVIGDDAGNPGLPGQVSQNSQNLAFYSSLIDTDPKKNGIQPYSPTDGGIFDVKLEYGDAQIQARFHLGDADLL